MWKGKRVPVREVPFLLDQRELRQMQIGNLYTKVTKTIKKRLARDKKASQTRKKRSKWEQPTGDQTGSEEESEGAAYYYNPNEDSSVDMDLPQKYGTTFKNLALASDRFGVSDRAASAIAMAILTDFT